MSSWFHDKIFVANLEKLLVFTGVNGPLDRKGR